MGQPMDWRIIDRTKQPADDLAQQLDLVVIRRPRVLSRRSRYRMVKRLMDLTLCLLALPFVMPVMAICAAIVYLDSSRPIFFVQERIGKGGRVFRMYKFRTMRPNLDDANHRAFMKAFVNGQIEHSPDGRVIFKPVQASQITPAGRILRKTSLDELPQIINVLKGEMSLVGPRPERPFFVDQLTREIPFYAVRHSVKPGVTGWAQVCYHYGATVEDSAEKLQYDLYYVKNHSLFLDLVILVETVGVVITGKGAH